MKFKSPVYTQVSGSIGGLTYAHNKGGMYSRGRGLPTNPNTPRQQNMRTTMTTLVQAWNLLTDEQRATWDLYAANVTVLNKLGDPIYLSGQQHFIRSNSLRLQITAQTADFATPLVLAQVDAGPSVFNTGVSPGQITLAEIATGTLTLEGIFPDLPGATGYYSLFVGTPINAGKTFYKGPYQLAWADTFGATDTGWTISADLTDAESWWSTYIPLVNVQMPYRLRLNYNDGRLSADYRGVITPVVGT